MFHRLFILLLLTFAVGLSVKAQTKKTTSRPPAKTTATRNDKTKSATPIKTDTAAKKTAVAKTPVKDSVKTVQAAPAYSQATVAKTPAPPVAEKIKKTEPTMQLSSPFAKGTLRLSHKSMITFYRYDRKSLSPGKDNDLDGTLGLTWFPVNGLGVGVDARYYNSEYTTPGTSSDFSSWSAYFHLLYGYSFSDRYHAYMKVGYGPAKSDSKTKLGVNNQRLKSSFNDLSITVGGPIRVEKQGRLFVTPTISYDQYKGEAGTHDITDKTTGFVIRPESYLQLGDRDNKQPVNYYAKGTQFIDYNSQFDLHSTKRNEKLGTILFAPRTYNTRFFHLGYGLYVMDNVAAGLNIELSHRKDKTPGSPDDIRKYVSLQPSVIAQVPVKGPLNNLFGQVSYEFSRGSQSGSVKTKESNIDLRLGYHLFVARNLALTPRIGYSMEKYTSVYVTSGDIVAKSKGLAGELMLRAWLNWKWMK